MKYDVFISYSRKDTEIANQVCFAFDKVGITYFIDRQGIGGGKEFPLVLADAICDSRIFLFLASRNSYESKFTNSEITFAFNEKPHESIFPYIIDNSQLPRHLRFVFSSINWRNILEHPIETVLVPDLLDLLGKNVAPINNVGMDVPIGTSLPNNAVEDNDCKSLFDQAYSYWGKGDYKNSFPLFLDLANKGYKDALGYLGMAYELGEGVERNYEMMMHYYKQAIESHVYVGVYRLGKIYKKEAQYNKAMELYEKAINEGWATADAYINLGQIYEQGLGVKIDLEKAILYYTKAKENSNSIEAEQALERLGTLYDEDSFEIQLPDTIRKMSAERLYRIAKKNTEGRERNIPLAFAYFKVAAEKGHAMAANNIIVLAKDKDISLPAKLISQYKKLASDKMMEFVKDDPSFAWDAGYAYQYGSGCEKDIEKAKQCYYIGSQDGDASCQWKLGLILENEGDDKSAFQNYKDAAESGQGMAMYELARCYEKGIGTGKDINAAIKWYEKCAESRYAASSDANDRLKILKT